LAAAEIVLGLFIWWQAGAAASGGAMVACPLLTICYRCCAAVSFVFYLPFLLCFIAAALPFLLRFICRFFCVLSLLRCRFFCVLSPLQEQGPGPVAAWA
jgi:hypothetical protein